MSKTLRSFTSAGTPARASYTAEIVEHTPYTRFAADMEGAILVITDHNDGARSVTNAIDEVLLQCRERLGLDLPGLVIYRDSTGRWDGVNHCEGTFRSFYAIGETDRDRAIVKAVAHT